MSVKKISHKGIKRKFLSLISFTVFIYSVFIFGQYQLQFNKRKHLYKRTPISTSNKIITSRSAISDLENIKENKPGKDNELNSKQQQRPMKIMSINGETSSDLNSKTNYIVFSDTPINLTNWDGISQKQIRLFNFNPNCYNNQTNQYIGNCIIDGSTITADNSIIAATITILTTGLDSDINPLKRNLNNLKRNFYEVDSKRKIYPITIFHESDVNIQHMIQLSSIIPFVEFYFVEIEFWIPEYTYSYLNSITKDDRDGNINEDHHTITVHPVFRITNTNKNNKINDKTYIVHEHGLHSYNKRTNTNPYGYYHMCRFWMSFYKLPFMNNFNYYMRLDSDSNCNKIQNDYFNDMYLLKNQNIYYFYYKFTRETNICCLENMWNTINNFLQNNDNNSRNNISENFNQNLGTVGKNLDDWLLGQNGWQCMKLNECNECLDNTNNNLNKYKEFGDKYLSPNCNRYSLLSHENCNSYDRYKNNKNINIDNYYIKYQECNENSFHWVPGFGTNFEVLDINNIFRTEIYNKFLNYIDKQHGFYQFRWGDANLRWAILSMLIKPNQMKKVSGCNHGKKL